MGFCNEILKLQEKYKHDLILVSSGIFLTAIGRDARLLEKEFGLKPICIKEKICKCVIPIKSSEKYLILLAEKNLNTIIFEYDKNTKSINEVATLLGRNIDFDKYGELHCENCWYMKKSKRAIKVDVIENVEKINMKRKQENARK